MLPQVCNDREILRAYFDSSKLSGFDYAYLYPGMNKVLQSARIVSRIYRAILQYISFPRKVYLVLTSVPKRSSLFFSGNVDSTSS